MLGGIVHAHMASIIEWRSCVEALQAKVTKVKAIAGAKEVHMQEETTWALARERELWWSYERLVFLFCLCLIFQAKGPLFLHTSLGICPLLYVHRVDGAFLLRLRGLLKI